MVSYFKWGRYKCYGMTEVIAVLDDMESDGFKRDPMVVPAENSEYYYVIYKDYK